MNKQCGKVKHFVRIAKNISKEFCFHVPKRKVLFDGPMGGKTLHRHTSLVATEQLFLVNWPKTQIAESNEG